MRSNYIEKIEYRDGILEPGIGFDDLPVRTWSGKEIPAAMRDFINRGNLLSMGGVYGRKRPGESCEYDGMRIICGNETVEIVVYNRSEMVSRECRRELKYIHSFLDKLMSI